MPPKPFALICGLLLMQAASTAQNTTSGSVVYMDNSSIRVTNLTNGKTKSFSAISYAVRGVSVSDTGVIAQLQERSRDDAVLVYLTKLDGTFIKEFTYAEKRSFPVSSARISRDGQLVVFALRTLFPNGQRGDRVVACEIFTERDCALYDNLRDPAWLPDNRFVAVNEGKQFYISDPINFQDFSKNRVNPIGPDTLDRANLVNTSPDGRYAVFSSKAGVPRVYALNLQTGNLKAITEGGVGQHTPTVSPDGKFLYYMQPCCQRTPGLGGGVSTGWRLHRIPFRPETTTPTPYLQNVLRDSDGSPLDPDGQYGLTPQK